ncbi:MAG TPA: DUF1217 domain-containing protein [Hyphomicrobiaceae bacterium]|nr:DUF1217 domain-containing protein [Hyphomicrobiaceae bacterium]
MTRTLDATAAKPQVARESDYYLAHIRDVKSIDDFLNDDRLFTYAMKAWGLGDMSYAKAFMRKVLTEGTDSQESFANKLSDSRYRDFANVFNFKAFGSATTAFDKTQQGTVDMYVRQTMEEDVGTQNEGVRLGLYFERKATSIKTPLQILADPALLKVVQTALRLPVTMSLLDIDKQVDMISAKLDVADFQDPDKLAKFLRGFASLYDLDNPQTTSATPSILFSQPLETGIGADLLASLQNLKLGGI